LQSDHERTLLAAMAGGFALALAVIVGVLLGWRR
jgi:hypothetical protein